MSKLTRPNETVVDLSPIEFTHLSDPPLLIDVRSSLEYITGHAPNTCNLSLPRILLGLGISRWFLPRWFQALPKNQSIAVICLTAHRSPFAAQQLLKAGFTSVYNIKGGMVEWHRLGLKTEAKAQAS